MYDPTNWCGLVEVVAGACELARTFFAQWHCSGKTNMGTSPSQSRSFYLRQQSLRAIHVAYGRVLVFPYLKQSFSSIVFSALFNRDSPIFPSQCPVGFQCPTLERGSGARCCRQRALVDYDAGRERQESAGSSCDGRVLR